MTDPVTKVLMLDFDNVLNDNAHILATAKEFPGIQTYNPDMGRAMLDPVRCARIQRVCDATGAAILLVTGWRKWAKWEDLAVLLEGRGITAKVVGAVGGVKMWDDLRASAAREWLDAHPEVTRYVVIDDDEYRLWGRGKNHPWKDVMVMPKDGIEDEHVTQAIEILNQE